MRSRGCRGMGEAAPTGWLGVGRPVGPPVPWPRDMQRALPAPGRVSRSPTSRGVPRAKPGGIDAGPGPGSGPAFFAEGTPLVRARTDDPAEKASCPKTAHLSISLREAAGVCISLDAFEPTPRPPDGLLRCSWLAWESARVSSTTPLRRVPWPSLWLAFARHAAIAPCDRPPSTARDPF